MVTGYGCAQMTDLGVYFIGLLFSDDSMTARSLWFHLLLVAPEKKVMICMINGNPETKSIVQEHNFDTAEDFRETHLWTKCTKAY